jgi:hypothetical protein
LAAKVLKEAQIPVSLVMDAGVGLDANKFYCGNLVNISVGILWIRLI